jgi:hypothetical protein
MSKFRQLPLLVEEMIQLEAIRRTLGLRSRREALKFLMKFYVDWHPTKPNEGDIAAVTNVRPYVKHNDKA